MAYERSYLTENEELLRALKRERMRRGKQVFGIAVLVTIFAGFGVYFFSSNLGISVRRSELIAIGFLIAGGVDYLILHFWERIHGWFD